MPHHLTHGTIEQAVITFCIPHYQNADYLERALCSVRGQTRSDWKTIVCDEGMDPQVEPLIRQMGDSRIKLHRNSSRLGMVGNWNQCLDLAQTPYVTLLHSDDELLPHYAASVIEAHEQAKDLTVVFTGVEVIGATGKRVFSFSDAFKRVLTPARAHTLEGESGWGSLLRGCFVFCPTACFNKGLLGEQRFDARWEMVQDLEMWTRLLCTGHRLHVLDRTLYRYRRHSANATEQYTQDLRRFREEKLLYSELARTAEEQGWIGAKKRAEQAHILYAHLGFRLFQDLTTLRFFRARQKAALLSAWLSNKKGH